MALNKCKQQFVTIDKSIIPLLKEFKSEKNLTFMELEKEKKVISWSC